MQTNHFGCTFLLFGLNYYNKFAKDEYLSIALL